MARGAQSRSPGAAPICCRASLRLRAPTSEPPTCDPPTTLPPLTHTRGLHSQPPVYVQSHALPSHVKLYLYLARCALPTRTLPAPPSPQRLGEEAGGIKPVSKKEQAKLLEEKRESQGKRLRKQGAKANKFDAEAAGKVKNKKNGLMH